MQDDAPAGKKGAGDQAEAGSGSARPNQAAGSKMLESCRNRQCFTNALFRPFCWPVIDDTQKQPNRPRSQGNSAGRGQMAASQPGKKQGGQIVKIANKFTILNLQHKNRLIFV